MKSKLQIGLNEEARVALDSIYKDSNDGFKSGYISLSDLVNEIILTAKVDVRALQAKHTNIRKSLRLMASQKEIDVDSAIKSLMELRAKGVKKVSKAQTSFDEALS